jgi:hypothetical protein
MLREVSCKAKSSRWSWRMRSLMDTFPLLKALKWHLTAQVARDAVQLVQ